MKIRVALEMGPKGKKCVAVAPDWPGLERGAKIPELAVENLRLYFHRYVRVAELAGLGDEFSPDSVPDVVERYPGVGSTDFWGISFAFSSIDERAMSNGELNRELALMQACWEHFDVVRKQVSPQMRKGPRGGGRDRDHIVRHTLAVEQDWAKKLGVRTPQDAVITETRRLKTYRRDYCEAIRDHHANGPMARSWPLRFLIRHTAFHTMDHAWEMADKDLTARASR